MRQGRVMDALLCRLRRELEPLGYRVDASADGFTVKSTSGNFLVKGCAGLTLEQLEIRANDIVSGKPATLVPLPHSATARALKTVKRKS